MIEMDVQMSKDGVPVIIHDYTLERTTNGTGFVGDYSLQELKKLDAGKWLSPEFTGERIPTLEEVLQLILPYKNTGIKLNLEIKRGADFYSGIERRVIDLICRYGLESSILLTSFNHETIKNLSSMAPEISRGLIIYGVPTLIHEQLRYTKATVLSMCYPYLTSSFVRAFLDEGIGIIAWTVNNSDHMRQVASLDSRIAICTNYPNYLLSIQKN